MSSDPTMYSYSRAFLIAAKATDLPYAAIRALVGTNPDAPANNSAQIAEIGIVLREDTETEIGLGFTTAGTVTTSNQGIVEQGGGAPAASTGADKIRVETAWSAEPPEPTTYIRRVLLPATKGASVLWSWDREDPLEVTGNGNVICLWNIGSGTAGAFDLYVRWWCNNRLSPITKIAGFTPSA